MEALLLMFRSNTAGSGGVLEDAIMTVGVLVEGEEGGGEGGRGGGGREAVLKLNVHEGNLLLS